MFVEPPPEAKTEGEIWRLLKAGYGLYDSARLWYLEVIKLLEECGMTQVTGDEATYYYRVNNKLEGIVILHVDDFLTLGSDLFFELVVKKIKQKFKLSKVERDKFRFCGIDVEVTPEGIFINQNEYANAIKEIPVDKNDNPERPLTKNEYKAYRGAIGKLIWLNEITRPDISYNSLTLSFNNKNAKVKDILAANKVIQKATKTDSLVKFSEIGKFENLKLLTHTDASHLTLEQKSKGVAGKIIFLSNKEETIVIPTVLAMKQMLVRKQIGRFDWVESYDCLADVLTKSGAKGTEGLLKILKTGINE